MNRRRRLFILGAFLLALLLIWAGGWKMARAGEDGDWRKALEVMVLVKLHYVDPVSLLDLLRGYMEKGTINGMLAVLHDPYTRYLDSRAYQEMKIDTTGEFGGIGIYVGANKERQIIVVAPIEGTPAARAGIKAGDIIVAINGRSTEEMSVDEAVTLMRGPKGTVVQLRLRRGSSGPEYEVRLVREIIKVPRVEAKMLPDRIGYIKLAGFSETSVQDLDRALADLDRRGMAGLILDLRYNPGGLMNIAVEIAQRFIQRGPILHVSGRNQQERQSFYASGQASYPDLPMVVLVNQGSASASEILAGALKDHKRALLVGTKTFGKGLVQTIIPLYDGSALSLTTQKWFTAGGHSIALEGITPDVVVKNPGDEEMARELEKIKRGEESEAGKEQEQPETEQSRAPNAAGTETGRDYQLERAVQILKAQLAERQALRKAS